MSNIAQWGYFAAFTPTAYIILGSTVLLAFAFLCGFIAWNYRERRQPGYVAKVAERNRPDVIDEPDPPIPGALLEEFDALPLTHSKPSMPWRHS